MDTQAIQSYIQKSRAKGYSANTIKMNVKSLYGIDLPDLPETPRPKTLTDTVMDLAPTAGSIIGGIGGTMAAGPVGGIIGAGAGGAAGEAARQAYTPEQDTNVGKMVTEGAFGAGGELVGLGIGKLVGKGIGAIGSKVMPRLAEDVATKNLGKTAVKTFAKKAGGQTLGTKMIGYELVGKSAAEIAEEASKATGAYEAAISASSTPVSVFEVFDELMKKAGKLLGNANPSVHSQGEALQEIAERTMKAYADNPIVTPAHILEQKRLVGDILSKTAYDEGAKKAVNTIHEDVLRNVLNKAVPEAKGLGQKVRDLLTIEDIVKGAEQLQAGGRGQPWLPIATAGLAGGMGGIPAAATGYLAGTAANSPKVTQALANTLMKTAPGVAEMGSKIAANTIGNAVGRSVVGQGIARTPKMILEGMSTPATQTKELSSPAEAVSTLAPGLSGVTGTSPAGEAGETTKQSVLDRMNIDENKFLTAYLRNPTNPTLKAIYEIYSNEQKGTNTKKTAEVARYEDAASQLEALGAFIDKFEGKMGPVKGALNVLNPYDPDAQQLQANVKAVAQIVGRAMEGGVLRKEDVPKYEAILPNLKDTPESARRKINDVRIMLQRSARNIAGAEAAITINPTSPVQ